MITKISYRDQVREYLQNQMLLGNLDAGQTISLAGLARELEVSATPIREALTQLEQAKIISSIPNRGFIITEINAKEAKNIYELIATLESLALENSGFSEKIIKELIAAQKKFSEAKTAVEKIKADMNFHTSLTGNYDNPFAQQIIRDLKTRIFFYEKAYMQDADFTETSDDQHLEIIELVKNNEQTKAAKVLRENWLIILEYIQKHLKTRQAALFVFVTFALFNPAFGQINFDSQAVTKPKLFAEGIISTDIHNEYDIAFTGDGKTAYFTRRAKGAAQKIYVSDFADGKWSAPRIAPFSTDRDETPFIAPDGKTLYFGSARPIPERVSKGTFDMNIWKVSQTEKGWSAPVPLSEKINKIQIEKEEFPSSGENLIYSIDGENFYFSTMKRGTKGIDVYKTTLKDGDFTEAEKVSGAINSDTLWEYTAVLSPNGNYMFFNTYESPKGVGREDIFVSRKAKNGWSKPLSLGSLINSKADEGFPRFSPDGKYFFFSRDDKKAGSKDENWNLYFVETTALNLENLFEQEKIVRQSEITGDISDIKLKANGQMFTGKIVDHYADGRPKLWREVKNGFAEGLWMEWLENGNLRYKAEWKRGKGDGLWQYFHDNGTLSSEGFYEEDSAEGVHYFWHSNGQLKVKGVYRNNKQEGRWVYLLPSGETEKIEVFENGKKTTQ
jgi:DNA-binding GntR family transcriptional regulator/antitoxin component YwqK of YwqJK toxin-antitoxin module